METMKAMQSMEAMQIMHSIPVSIFSQTYQLTSLPAYQLTNSAINQN
jgi:hypothetical protein